MFLTFVESGKLLVGRRQSQATLFVVSTKKSTHYSALQNQGRG